MQEVRLTGERSIEFADGTRGQADRIVLATGSRATAPPVPGLADGPFWTNREAIWEPDTPPASLTVIGTGAIGIEFAQLYARFGTRVTAIEVQPQLMPKEDDDVARALAPALEEDGIRLLVGVTIERADHDGSDWTLRLEGGETIAAEQGLVAAGRRPVFDVHDLDAAGVEIDDRGRPILSPTLRTTAPDLWAAGD